MAMFKSTPGKILGTTIGALAAVYVLNGNNAAQVAQFAYSTGEALVVATAATFGVTDNIDEWWDKGSAGSDKVEQLDGDLSKDS